MSVAEGAAVGVWLGVLSRGVVGALSGGEERGKGAAWNIVQANGELVMRSHCVWSVFLREGESSMISLGGDGANTCGLRRYLE
jgi:hypothetical protein